MQFDSEPFRCHVATLGKVFTHTCASVTKHENSGTSHRSAMSCGWEGSRRSGVTNFSGLSAYGLKAYR